MYDVYRQYVFIIDYDRNRCLQNDELSRYLCNFVSWTVSFLLHKKNTIATKE